MCVLCWSAGWLVGWPQMRADVTCICMHVHQVLPCYCYSSESLSALCQERMDAAVLRTVLLLLTPQLV